MSENPTEPAETIVSESTTVACDGGTLGHPRVFLSLLPDGQEDCPYCGRRYVLAEGAKGGAGH